MNGVGHFDNRRRLGRRASFVLLVCANVLMMATASAPSLIYPQYRERWGFSVNMLTVIFAVYVAGLLGALLAVGSLSDHLGRRPVLVAALVVTAASTAIRGTSSGPGAHLRDRLRHRLGHRRTGRRVDVQRNLRVISAATSAKARSEVFSAAYVISYTALSVPSLAAGLLVRWWGLEATAYLYVAFVAVLSVIAAVDAGRPQVHQRTDDGRSATSAAGAGTTRATSGPRAEPPQPPHTDELFWRGFEHASDHRARP